MTLKRAGDANAAMGDDMNKDVNNPEHPADPDNPPMTGKEVWVPARQHFLKKYAEIKARIAARKHAEQTDRRPTPKSNSTIVL